MQTIQTEGTEKMKRGKIKFCKPLSGETNCNSFFFFFKFISDSGFWPGQTDGERNDGLRCDALVQSTRGHI